jgi:hypothetical protein
MRYYPLANAVMADKRKRSRPSIQMQQVAHEAVSLRHYVPTMCRDNAVRLPPFPGKKVMLARLREICLLMLHSLSCCVTPAVVSSNLLITRCALIHGKLSRGNGASKILSLLPVTAFFLSRCSSKARPPSGTSAKTNGTSHAFLGKENFRMGHFCTVLMQCLSSCC